MEHYYIQTIWTFSWLNWLGCLQLHIIIQVVGTLFVRHRDFLSSYKESTK